MLRCPLNSWPRNFHILQAWPKINIFLKKKVRLGVPIVAQQVKNPTSIHEDAGLIPGFAQWLKDPALP